jgi:hypothetical protein
MSRLRVLFLKELLTSSGASSADILLTGSRYGVPVQLYYPRSVQLILLKQYEKIEATLGPCRLVDG